MQLQIDFLSVVYFKIIRSINFYEEDRKMRWKNYISTFLENNVISITNKN